VSEEILFWGEKKGRIKILELLLDFFFLRSAAYLHKVNYNLMRAAFSLIESKII
jgi:hypothetical protein